MKTHDASSQEQNRCQPTDNGHDSVRDDREERPYCADTRSQNREGACEGGIGRGCWSAADGLPLYGFDAETQHHSTENSLKGSDGNIGDHGDGFALSWECV